MSEVDVVRQDIDCDTTRNCDPSSIKEELPDDIFIQKLDNVEATTDSTDCSCQNHASCLDFCIAMIPDTWGQKIINYMTYIMCILFFSVIITLLVMFSEML